jgi:transposase
MVSIERSRRSGSKHQRGTTTKYYAGIDVSLNSSNVCVVDASGNIVREGKAASEPVTLITWLSSLGVNLERIGLEAGPLSQWLYGALREAGLAVELLETRHVKTALSTMPVKTDRNDARGIAQLMRLGWFRPVHWKSMAAQGVRALLTARKLVQSKLYDIEMSLRGILRGFGLKVGPTTSPSFAARINHLVDGQTSLEVVAAALLSLHAASVTGLGLSILLASSSRRLVLLSGVGAWSPPDGCLSEDRPANLGTRGRSATMGIKPRSFHQITGNTLCRSTRSRIYFQTLLFCEKR